MLITLKSMANNKFVCAENAGAKPLIANRDAAAEWETFDAVDLGNNRVALRAMVNKKFVCAENAGTLALIANRDAVGQWETFEKIALGASKFAYRSLANGKFICAENAGQLPLIANRDKPASWETFEEIPLKLKMFAPDINGFRFENDGFKNDVIPALNIQTDALCGGMCYAALDYYYSSMPVPDQPYRPANRTVLRQYLYDRQVESITCNLDKWAEVIFNPFGSRNTEFFNWGISAGRINEMRAYIDQGKPCVLCLKSLGDLGHQIIAIGYKLGRYKGDLGAYVEDFEIYAYDPNKSGIVRTFIADRARQVFCPKDRPDIQYRTYFVDKNYHVRQPPSLPNVNYPNDGLVHELVLAFSTAGDDLRGGNDNVNLVVSLADGSQQSYQNINLGAHWVPNSTEFAQVVLQRPVRKEQLRKLVVSTTFGGGISGDNWDMNSLTIYVRGAGLYLPIKSVGAKRFTGSDKTLTITL